MLVQYEADLVVVHVQPELFEVIHVVVLIAVATGQSFRRLRRFPFVVPHGHFRVAALFQRTVVVVIVIVVGAGSIGAGRSHIVDFLDTSSSSCRSGGRCSCTGGQWRFAVPVIRRRTFFLELCDQRWIRRLTSAQVTLQKPCFPVTADEVLQREGKIENHY